MAVLIEAISVVISRAAVDARYAGGPDAFLKAIPNRTFCNDEHLMRVGFMDSGDANAYVAALQAAGLVYLRGEVTADFCVVVQAKGPTVTSPWIEFKYVDGEKQKMSFCWAAGTAPKNISIPVGWKYEGSLSATGGGFMPLSAIGDRMKFLRREDGVEVYLDLQTGSEVFVGRPQISGDAPAALATQIDAAVHEAFAIEKQGPVPKPGFFGRKDPRYTRLNDQLLPEIKRIARGPGKELTAAHFAEGVIQRLLGRLSEAEKSFRNAHALAPQLIGPLRDLVRCIAEQGRPHDALPFARLAADLDATDAAALGNLAACLMQCGERIEALQVVNRALEIDPNDAINRNIQKALTKKATS
jgi:hypothetical protein